MLSAVAAVSRCGGLGYRGELLFHIPEDMQRFRALTMGGTLILGRKTLDSLPGGGPLPGRAHLVLTRNEDFHRAGVRAVNSVEVLLAALPDFPMPWVVAGGAELYRLLLPLCDTIYLTEVDADPPADTFFPPLPPAWRVEEVGPWAEAQGVRYRFLLVVSC